MTRSALLVMNFEMAFFLVIAVALAAMVVNSP